MPNIQTIINKINHSIVGNADIERVIDVLRSGFLSKPDGGPVVDEFQKLMAEMHDKRYAFAVSSGTSALHCAIIALALQKDDEVIIPALANIADASVVIQEGGRPVFVDINSRDFNIDPTKIEERITPKTRAIIVVHMYGQPANMEEIRHISDKHKLILIEDCAQAAGAKYKGKYVGSFGDVSCFSLYQTKHIICGEGGLVITNNEEYAKIITSVANNGIMKDDLDAYDYDRIGFNYQLTDIQAALAIGQLLKLDKNNKRRRENAEEFRFLLKDIEVQFQNSISDTEHSYFYLTGLLPQNLINKRDEFIDVLKKSGVPVKKLYPLALTELRLFRDQIDQNCLIAQNTTKRLFNLYVNPGLDLDDIALMAKIFKKSYETVKTSSYNG